MVVVDAASLLYRLRTMIKLVSILVFVPWMTNSFLLPRIASTHVQNRVVPFLSSNIVGRDEKDECNVFGLRIRPMISSFLLAEANQDPVEKSSAVQFSTIEELVVQSTDGRSIKLKSIFPASTTANEEKDKKVTILACLSHFGDFNAWEVTQQYISAIDSGSINGDCNIILVGIGSVDSASTFADDLNLRDYEDRNLMLVADEIGVVTDALKCYRGWLAIDESHRARWPQTDVNPYIKLFGMIFGFGSPGTMGRVLYGYIGDKENGGVESRKWVVDALLAGTANGRFPSITQDAFEGVPADSGLRPFELATLRAQTGIHIVWNWGALGPKNGNLFTRMGGTFVFRNEECVYEYFDQGILTYAPIQEVLNVANSCAE